MRTVGAKYVIEVGGFYAKEFTMAGVLSTESRAEAAEVDYKTAKLAVKAFGGTIIKVRERGAK